MNPIISKGKMAYNHSVNCKSIIRLKKDIRTIYPELHQNKTQSLYTIECHSTYQSLFCRIINIIERKQKIPLLVFIENE